MQYIDNESKESHGRKTDNGKQAVQVLLATNVGNFAGSSRHRKSRQSLIEPPDALTVQANLT